MCVTSYKLAEKTFFKCKNGTEGTKACFWYTKAKNGVT